jgi:uncharacterized protein YjbI with pentapeptide repeats
VGPGPKLAGVDGQWRGVILRGADLGRQDLAGLDLRDADLSMADLTASSLRGAGLDGVDLAAATLKGTKLDLGGAVLLAELAGAVVDVAED